MFEMENYKGLQFFHKDELMNTDILIQMGYQKSEVYNIHDCANRTTYFYNAERPFVFIICAWNINTDEEYYTQLIVSRNIVEKLGFPKTIHIENEKSTKKAVVYIGQRKQLIKTFLPRRTQNIVTSYTTLNVIDSQTTKYYDEEMRERDIIFPNTTQHNISVMKTDDIRCNDFLVEIIEKKLVFTDKILESLKQKDFKITSPDVDRFKLSKVFKTELEAWKAIWNYEYEYYQELRFDPFTDYISHNFEVAYRTLILDDLSVNDIIRMALYDWRRDWSKIVRCNLEELYKRYKIPYTGVLTDANGSMIPDCSNLKEVEDFKLE